MMNAVRIVTRLGRGEDVKLGGEVGVPEDEAVVGGAALADCCPSTPDISLPTMLLCFAPKTPSRPVVLGRHYAPISMHQLLIGDGDGQGDVNPRISG